MLSAVFLIVFIGQAEKNDFSATYYELNEAFSKIDEPSPNIEDYNIAHYFEYKETGDASWYGTKFHNRRTASGEKYDMFKLTAAHKSLPFGTIVRVTNNRTGEAVLLRITDRGPYAKKRIIDLSWSSATFISGSTNPEVKIEALVNTKNFSESDFGTRYMFGYSLEWPLVCIPQSVVDVVRTVENFDFAFEEYNRIREENPGQFVFLLTSPIQSRDMFYIGIFRPEMKNNSIDFVEK